MQGCKHETLEFVGEQKTDDGVNIYSKCMKCGTLVVVLPSSRVIGIPGVQADRPSATPGNRS